MINLPPFFDIEPDDFSEGLSWDMPPMPHKNAFALVHGNSVVLVRHFFAENGNLQKIYRTFLEEKIADNG